MQYCYFCETEDTDTFNYNIDFIIFEIKDNTFITTDAKICNDCTENKSIYFCSYCEATYEPYDNIYYYMDEDMCQRCFNTVERFMSKK